MSDTEKCVGDRVEIMGQIAYYPRTIWGTLSVISVLAGICIIVWIIAVKAKQENIEAITRPFAIARSTTEKTELIEGSYQIQFWTPSVRTKESKDIAPWEMVDTDEKLNKFADRLREDHRVQGYRRYDITGQGIGLRRNGMWWVMTVDNNYEVVDFVKAYQEFWRNEGAIYVEVLRSSKGKHVK